MHGARQVDVSARAQENITDDDGRVLNTNRASQYAPHANLRCIEKKNEKMALIVNILAA